MKKLIAFSVIFALLAGAVFALDLGSFNAQVDIRIDLFDTTQDSNNEAEVGGWDNGNDLKADRQVRFGFGYETSDGSAGIGGEIRLEGTLDGMGTGWWKPIDIVKIMLGGTQFDRMHNGWGNDNLWADYQNRWNGDGAPIIRATENFLAVEIGPVADMVMLKFGTLGNGNAGKPADKLGDSFVIQAVINLGEFGEVGLTYDAAASRAGADYDGDSNNLFIADYKATIEGIGILAAFAYLLDDKAFALSAQANYTIEGIGLMARFNGYSKDGVDDFAMQFRLEASYSMTLAELDFGTVTFAPRLNATLNSKNFLKPAATVYKNPQDAFIFGWSAPITIGKVIDGFEWSLGLNLSGETDFDYMGRMFRVRVPVQFKYRF